MWTIALLCLSLPLWLLWNAWSKSKKLDTRLNFCDSTLLEDSSVKVISVISAPVGTQVTENARFMVVPNNVQVQYQNMLLE
ncbi:MAG: hypothetical protein HN794_02495 [Euryarchaeota archaeon]|nr:hypothetical protein [Euryarchaeota archaeon]MBT4924698.1 hypothetical protein [Euryarchaeota archaeon]MBT5735748.1 hypothetical protein [Euryarchaeota archaeon]MBT7459892.1 hypothetical protein [Euryarchaeota archaeon]